LFPVKECFDECIDIHRKGFEEINQKPENVIGYINNLIDVRYRNKCYGINWLLYSLGKNCSKPDLSRISSYVKIHREDKILVAGISHEKHRKERDCLNPDYVINQIPNPERLVIGGFHQSSCVDKVAEASYKRGVETFVDEDTTELFFPKMCQEKIPLERKNWS